LNRLARAAESRRNRHLEILELHSGNHSFATSFFPRSVLRDAFQRFAEDLQYSPDPKGALSARIAIVDFYRNHFSHALDPENLILTSGSSESYAWIFRYLCEREGDRILSPVPAYPLFDSIADYSRVRLVPYNLNPSGQIETSDLDDLVSAESSEIRAVLLVSPGNPTGAILRRESLATAESFCRERNAALIFDEVFSNSIWD